MVTTRQANTGTRTLATGWVTSGQTAWPWPSYDKAEGVGVGTQLPQQPFLQASEGFGGFLGWREGLP